ncbi:hypothetical protein TIFTF001_034163 [Ficus carica]|uniref:Uncharacterized protein n=1 Tax=Ficus carica TaxID=3494 RepID=A0AA87YVH1_FICCA|nr:hypothetical protein TIFTF001_050298 [Ficus carica]GMN65105.1 hypothetical protein TIFTF001_034163 [Ficus carica]
MSYGYCRKARSSWRGNTTRREQDARMPETLNSLLETPAPGTDDCHSSGHTVALSELTEKDCDGEGRGLYVKVKERECG